MFFSAIGAFYAFSSDWAAARLPGGGARGAKDAWGAFGAVVATNAVIAAFVWSAFTERDDEPPSGGGGKPKPKGE